MLAEVWTTIGNTITDVFTLMSTLFDKFGITKYIIGVFVIYCTYRFLLKPLLGSNATGSSDKALKSRTKEADNKDG